MIIVRLKGGLGNQMFQYALGRVLALKNKTDLKLDISFFNLKFRNITKRSYDLDVFNIKAGVINKNKIVTYVFSVFKKIMKMPGQERGFNFDLKMLSLGPNACLDGYFQSYKYFSDFKNIIKKDFTLKNPLAQNIRNLGDEILNTNSLCIHVRRGDYVGNSYHEVVNSEYYKKGINYISGKTSIEKIYVFSDDISWCEENIKFQFPVMFVGQEYAGVKDEGHMYLMSMCKHFIIANSSFSWWSAWLSDYESKIVVCPKQWFGDASKNTGDLIPEEWKKI
ncbi:MAG: alpha-1,2-fucosyltransferase [Patescibacteria group bacterium]